LLRSLKPKSQPYDIWDAVVPSLGASALPSGIVSFVLGARFPGSRHYTRRALGGYGQLTLLEARAKARMWLSLIERGIDPQLQEERERQAAQRQQQMTFAAVAEDFIREKLSGERKGREIERDIRRDLIPIWGNLPISEITDESILDVIELKAKTAPAQARNLLGTVKRFFAWAKNSRNRRRYGVTISPAADLKPAEVVGAKNAGNRVLSDLELFALWRAAMRTPYPIGPVYRILILTALRLNEVADAAWSEFDIPGGVWIIPESRMKGRPGRARPHAVPLTDDMLALFEKLPHYSRGDYVFSTMFGATPVWMTTKVKDRIDTRILRTLKALARCRGEDPSTVKLAHWTNHDIRRTVRSNFSRLKIAEEVREALMAHARPGLKGVYDLHDYLDGKREALELWAARLRAIAVPSPANVVPLRVGA
jgi:integrase